MQHVMLVVYHTYCTVNMVDVLSQDFKEIGQLAWNHPGCHSKLPPMPFGAISMLLEMFEAIEMRNLEPEWLMMEMVHHCCHFAAGL